MTATPERTNDAVGRRVPGVFFVKAFAIGLSACSLLFSPWCLDAKSMNLGFAIGVVAASILAAWSLAAILRRPGVGWLVVACLSLPLLAAVYFGFGLIVFVRWSGGCSPAEAILDGLASTVIGPMMCVQFGWAMFPLGLVGAWWLRQDLVAGERDA